MGLEIELDRSIKEVVYKLVTPDPKKSRNRRALPFVIFEDGSEQELTGRDAAFFLNVILKARREKTPQWLGVPWILRRPW